MLAGGQSLLVLYRFGFVTPESFVSLQKIDELKTIDADARRWIAHRRGGNAIPDHRRSGDWRQRYPALVDSARCVSSPQVRRRGTLGGNLCHADPTADPPAALIALGASVEIAGPDGRRVIPVDALFADYMETILAPGELLTAVLLPPPADLVRLCQAPPARDRHRHRRGRGWA